MEQSEVEKLIGELETGLDRLRSLYEQYFVGIERIEPGVARKDVERRLYVLRKEQIRNTALRYRFQMVLQKFNTYQTHWLRICREIENGTYKRHLLRAQRRFGSVRPGRQRTSVPPPEVHPEPGAAPPGDLAAQFAELDREFAPPSFEVDVDLDDGLFDESASPHSPAPRSPEPAPRVAPLAPPAPAPARPRGLAGQPVWKKAVPGAAASPPTGAQPGPYPSPVPRPRSSPPAPVALARALPPAPSPPARGVPPAPSPPGRGVPSAPSPPTRGVPPAPSPPARGVPSAPSRPAPSPLARGVPPASTVPLRPPQGAPAGLSSQGASSQGASPQAAALRPPPPTPPSPAPSSSELSEKRLRQIYVEYVDAKRRQHESTAAITYQSVARSLRESGDKLRQKHGKTVDFEVAVKDGKTILRPVLK